MKTDFKILLIEDSASFRESLVQLLGVYNDVEEASNLETAREIFKKNSYEIVILDRTLPDGNGISLIPEIKAENPNTVVIILTSDSDFNSVKKCLSAGADDYVVKSENIIADLLIRIPYVVERAAEKRQLLNLKEQVRAAFKHELIGKSLAMAELRASILSLKNTNSHVLITGESGTGKELIARRLNVIEDERTRPFIAVNCGAIPENLVESELFGHMKGSFTGAITNKPGKFELAHNGDLFLDEIGDLPLSSQVKLLRVIQDGQFFRIGALKPSYANCRIIAATNKNIEEQVKKGKFREDLYYRLNVIRIQSIPLRARQEDIPDLAKFFILQLGGPSYTISEKSITRLLQHNWPGNIRELRNTIERAILKARQKQSKEIVPEDIVLDQRTGLGMGIQKLEALLPTDLQDLTETRYNNFLEIAEQEFLKAALNISHGSAADVGTRLGFARSTIFKKLAHLGISRRPYGTQSVATDVDSIPLESNSESNSHTSECPFL